jgi:hypothetical protein
MVSEAPSRHFFSSQPPAASLSLPPPSRRLPLPHPRQPASRRPLPRPPAPGRRPDAPTGPAPPHCRPRLLPRRPRPTPPPAGRAPASFPPAGHRASFPLAPPCLLPSDPASSGSGPARRSPLPRRRARIQGVARSTRQEARAPASPVSSSARRRTPGHALPAAVPQCVLRRLSKPHLPAPADRALALAAPRPSCTRSCPPDLRRPPPAAVWPLSRCAGLGAVPALPKPCRKWVGLAGAACSPCAPSCPAAPQWVGLAGAAAVAVQPAHPLCALLL